MTDLSSLEVLIKRIKPDEIYNLAAQSHVKVSFEIPIVTAETDALGALKILEAVRILGESEHIRFYQASTSELYGDVRETPQRETTPFYPRSPYGVAKLYSYWIVKNYREAYNIFASNGILFNHESERRGIRFVTRKITLELARMKLGIKKTPLELGNLSAERDWGYAPDYVEGMWKMLQADKPDDFVLATGEKHSVKEFVEEAASHLGFEIEWQGKGINEVGIDTRTGRMLIKVNPRYFRPAEVEVLLGDPTKARDILDWVPKTKFKELVRLMVENDLQRLRNKEVIY